MTLDRAYQIEWAERPGGVTKWGRVGALGLAAVIGALVGCGPRSDRLAVSGKVTLNGAPLDSGSIRFTSLGAEKLMTSGTMIIDGAYNVPQEYGLRAGSYQVEISSPDAKAKPILDRPSGMLLAPERIPEEYNLNSEHTIEVTADGENKFDFAILSKAAK